ncbi:MAG: AraC family transcriptional regulator [Ruminococcus sp.]|nr:AraC family transcriptional regulator [Ruminococcus sp.]
MKIIEIRINCKKQIVSGIDSEYDFVFFIFRSPVTCRTSGETIKFTSNSAGVFSRGNIPDFVPEKKHSLIFDYICFQTLSIDKQYILSMGIPINTLVPVYDDSVISNTLYSMKAEFSHSGIYRNEFMELSMKILLISLCEIAVREQEPDILHYDKLKALRREILANPAKPWFIDDICYHLNMSRTYFHRLYKQAFGVTCIQDVIENRLKYACELLKNTDLSISEIAEKCGYENDSYFMRQFRQYRNCTPSEYRRKSRN